MSTYDYAAPGFVLIGTEDWIHEAMLNSMPGDIDKTEGGFVWDATRPSAIELAQAYIALNETVKLIFPMFSYSGWLDLHGVTRSILRKEAIGGAGYVQMTGVAGLLVPAGLQLATASSNGEPNLIFEVTEDTRLSQDESGTGHADVPVRCVTPGADGNVPANSIVLMVDRLLGVSGVTNNKPITGGSDEESDDDLRDRIVAQDMSSEESFVGSPADYKRWAMSVPGVGGAVVVPLYDGAGTTKIVIVDENNKPANDEIVNAVIDYILSPNDPELRLAPVNAMGTILITAPVSREITISVSVKLADGADLDTATSQFREALSAYFNEAAEDGVLRYNRIGSALIGLDMVDDYDDLLLNGDVENISLAADEYPMLGDNSLTVVSYV